MGSRQGISVIILAAGYGTRLGGEGEGLPKGLLELQGRPLLDHLVGDLPGLGDPTAACVVTNDLFAEAYEAWAERASRRLGIDIQVLNNGTRSAEERRGGVGDLAFGLRNVGLARDALVLVTDTLIGFPLVEFVAEFERIGEADALLAVLEERDSQVLARRGVVQLTENGRVTGFQEKPGSPLSHDTALPMYLLRAGILSKVFDYLASGGDPDSPGHLLEWLVPRINVYAWKAWGSRIDVGTPEGYRAALERFRE